MFGSSGFGAAKPTYNPNNDIEVQTPPDLDGISSLSFSVSEISWMYAPHGGSQTHDPPL